MKQDYSRSLNRKVRENFKNIYKSAAVGGGRYTLSLHSLRSFVIKYNYAVTIIRRFMDNNFIELSREADISIEFATHENFRIDVYLSTFNFTRWNKIIAVA